MNGCFLDLLMPILTAIFGAPAVEQYWTFWGLLTALWNFAPAAGA